MTQKLGPLQQQWVDALRSGKYTQGKRALRNTAGSEPKFCCLGVLCDVVDPAGWGKENMHHGMSGMPSEKIMERLGLSYSASALNYEEVSLTVRNDDDDWTFEQIADELEQYPETWFSKSA